ncbi:hypothetical protein BDU57DRAFT_468448 [Ampelomyces quisqualis]|uniref:DUF7730 domain-containing protein n=1 Tax=Ampelomyces quisqualis TaxID=50730 RepID=A0A6A5QVT2_AMPQU|nr:hypothetical protein BDU57DRAFT_468448 [Ampelomyces quisqualis]
MRRIIRAALRRKRPDREERADGFAHGQEQSPLFRVLSPEIRLLIYEDVFSADRLLHIVLNHGRYLGRAGNRRHGQMQYGPMEIGHWHCFDAESPLPTWQHACYGTYQEGNGYHYRHQSRSNSNLLPLLLACRKTYVEAIGVLYGSSRLCFKGAVGLLKFQSLIPAQNWQRLRRINISTVFLIPVQTSKGLFPGPRPLPPEIYHEWEEACFMICTLPCVQSLTIDLTIWNYHDWKTTNTIGLEDLMEILEPLQQIKAKSVDLELNAKVPDSVRAVFEPLNFNIREFHRPYNRELFRQG